MELGFVEIDMAGITWLGFVELDVAGICGDRHGLLCQLSLLQYWQYILDSLFRSPIRQ